MDTLRWEVRTVDVGCVAKCRDASDAIAVTLAWQGRGKGAVIVWNGPSGRSIIAWTEACDGPIMCGRTAATVLLLLARIGRAVGLSIPNTWERSHA